MNRQRYKCFDCGHVFEGKRRASITKKKHALWKAYSDGKQTYHQLSELSGYSKKWVQKGLGSNKYPTDINRHPKKGEEKIVLGMDATYWGRGFGVMLFRDITHHKNLFWFYIGHETVPDYLLGMKTLEQRGWEIQAIVCDGKSGLINAIDMIPVLLCQYHAYKTVINHITQNPKLQAGKELKEIAGRMFYIDKETFVKMLEEWYSKWKTFIDERTISNDTKRKWRYKHSRIRSAYKTLFKNKDVLFTWDDYLDLNIPNTNNSIEGVFSNLKNKLSVHNGLKREKKRNLINHFLAK